MAGKTGTCQTNYSTTNKTSVEYIASFSGYFPADNPKYSCIVVIHKPRQSKGYYGADVAGPVFKKIAQKIYKDAPIVDEVDFENIHSKKELNSYDNYYAVAASKNMPNVIGMHAMDAVSVLENLGLKVVLRGNGRVTQQSIDTGEKIVKKKTIVLELS